MTDEYDRIHIPVAPVEPYLPLSIDAYGNAILCVQVDGECVPLVDYLRDMEARITAALVALTAALRDRAR